MFTGIVELIGTVVKYEEVDETAAGGNGVSITIEDCAAILDDVHLGDSISTNGVCLTVTDFNKERTWFTVGVSPETLRRSNLGNLHKGSKVNLERAVSGHTRLGGHVVQGHVDTMATITKKEPDGNSIVFTFKLRDADFIKYIVEKGFIAIDGTSLTVTNVDDQNFQFSIMLVSYTQQKVILPQKSVGDTVNIEVDLTGKLIEKQIEIYLKSQIVQEDGALNKLISSLIDKKINTLTK
ncbi:uncharacterized protein PRCAT00005604001 [Priceomyces carsonii]|uniref:uncharacterized protein n=1 Tax=Priceomyces carsonii TaxID=28549 RepID=UPI002ED79F61|nr:unnamed protein product [Priceomyces carsonii]